MLSEQSYLCLLNFFYAFVNLKVGKSKAYEKGMKGGMSAHIFYWTFVSRDFEELSFLFSC